MERKYYWLTKLNLKKIITFTQLLNHYCNNYNNFSLGLTLEEIYVVNTNEKWEPEFIDRNKKQNFNRNMYKLLKLSNFGMYLKCNETLYLSALKTKDEIQKEMRELFPVGAQKVDCVDYLIQPSKITFLNYIFLIYSFTNRENEASIWSKVNIYRKG